MSQHLSLYRRFRPDSFDKIVRQEHVVRVLQNQIVGGTVGHAYLFCGPRGTGKTSVARIFARAVNCENPANGSPCGVCPACRALREGSLDLTEIDAASNNGVNEMRDLREKVQYPPVSVKYKVYIVDEVHMLTDSAFNALLKTLEEPPAHAIFILATTEPHKIPATILSRCMRLDFKLIPEEDLEKHLCGVLDEIGKPYEKEAVSAIARAGAGSDRDMLSIAETCLSYGEKLTYETVTEVLGAADFNQTSALCGELLAADLPAVLERAEGILSAGKSVGVLCKDVLEMLNRIAVAKTCRTAEKLLSLPKTQFERVREIAKEADGRAVLRATEILAKTESDLRFVSSPRICFETALMKIAVPAADENTDALLVRIAALEKKVEALSARPPVSPAAPVSPVAPVQSNEPASSNAPVQSNEPASSNAPARAAERSSQKAAQTDEQDYLFPTEEPVFDEGYFSDPFPKAQNREPLVEKREPVVQKSEPAERKSEPTERKSEAENPFSAASSEQPARAAGAQSAELAYGKFVRLLRKTCRNGVLFTMCSDLEPAFEGEKLVLFTTSGTVFRSLCKEEHRALVQDVFRQLGIAEYEIRMKGEPAANAATSTADALKRDFKDYPVEIK